MLFLFGEKIPVKTCLPKENALFNLGLLQDLQFLILKLTKVYLNIFNIKKNIRYTIKLVIKADNSKISLSQNFVILITFFVTIFLLNNEFIIKYFVWQLPDLFMDMKQGVAWLKCHSLGFDIYNNIEPCYHQRMNLRIEKKYLIIY